jgi:HK97 gp10 family phage protein
MIRGRVNAQPALDHIEEVKFRAIEAIQLGTQEAMDDLAAAASGNAAVRTGRLRAAILGSPKVTTTKNFISGTVSGGDYGNARHVTSYLEFGTSVPEVIAKKLMVFVAPDGHLVFTKKHKAFQVAARPFMNPTLQSRKAAMIEKIADRIRSAVE